MIGLTQAQFEGTFPFHFAVNENLDIVQAGPSLRKLCGFDPVGSSFSDLFEVSHPSGTEPVQASFLENAGLLFVLDFKL